VANPRGYLGHEHIADHFEVRSFEVWNKWMTQAIELSNCRWLVAALVLQ
jgi:hypothetical protein